MKKSSLLLLGALGSIFIFTLIFQVAVHQNVKEVKANQKPMVMQEIELNIPSFSSIAAGGNIKIYFEHSTGHILRVNAPDYQMDSVVAKVTGRTLHLGPGKGLRSKDSVVVHVGSPGLDSLVLSSNAHFTTKGQISGPLLQLVLKDDSSAQLDLAVDKLIYKNTSSGQVTLKGAIKNLEIMEDKPD
nr:DUF2807 domain-containing protein [Allomuricauda sp.]